MLTKWKIFNFKAIQQETELQFKPLTIFAGANSSGKSTVLQSILLVAQTLANEVTNRPIVLNGDLVRLGQFDDIKSIGSEAAEISFGWTLDSPEESAPHISLAGLPSGVRSMMEPEQVVRRMACAIAFDAVSGSAASDVLQLQPALFSMSLEAQLWTNDGELSSSVMNVRQATISDEQPETMVGTQGGRYIIEFDHNTEDDRQAKTLPHEIDGVVLRHFLPSRLLASFTAPQVRTEAIMRALSGDSRYSMSRNGFASIADESLSPEVIEIIAEHLSDGHPLREWIANAQRDPGTEIKIRDIETFIRRRRARLSANISGTIDQQDDLRLELTAVLSKDGTQDVFRKMLPIPEELQPACRRCSEWFSSSVKYLGPLRDDPKPLYPLVSNIDPSDVGLRGEHTASVFHSHREKIVEFLSAENFKLPRITPVRSKRTLKFAVFEWLKYLGVATALETQDKGKLGHEMQVRLHESDLPHDLTHVGVGVSQVLPIVVSCLLAEPDTMLIFEQPELHLHPMVQERLADFFLAMAMLGKQCVLETHSEYLINRFRFRAAAAEGSQLVETIQIYFAEKNGIQSSFRPIVVNEYGAILDWPEGFFDQSQTEAEGIIREAIRKRKHQQRAKEQLTEAHNGEHHS